MTEYIVTVMASDRAGIVRDVSAGLAELQGNITHASQTVLRGYFTLILSAQLPDSCTPLMVRQSIERHGQVGEFEVNVRPFVEGVPVVCHGEPFTLTLRTHQVPGMLLKASSYLAQRGINIEDFNAYATDSEFLVTGLVTIPADVDVESVKFDLEALGREYAFSVQLMHQNVFTVTSQVMPVTELMEGAE